MSTWTPRWTRLGRHPLERLVPWVPPPVRAEPVSCAVTAPPLPIGHPLTLLTWNVQFCAGRNQQFFYDGGDGVRVPPATVRRVLDGIGAVLREVDADVVVLQEVDRHSRRTGYIDQHRALLERVPFACHTSTPYFRVPYVPHPPRDPLGRMDMHLSVLSRYRLGPATRYQLPLLREWAVRRLLNLRRAVFDVRLPLEEGGELALFATHLSAFARGDGTLARQIGVLLDHLGRSEVSGLPWVLAGDLNALPPGDDPGRLGPAAALYPEADSPLAPLFRRFHSPVAAERLAADPALRTFQPFRGTPDRVLDYVLHGSRVVARDLEVLPGADALSDHLPVLFRFSVREV